MMSELILQGIDIFLKKTGTAGTLYMDADNIRTGFLVLGIILIFLGAKIYTAVMSFVMFWGVTVILCTIMDGHAKWGSIVTAFTITGCLLGYMAFKWKTADSMLFSALTAAAIVWMNHPSLWMTGAFAIGIAAAAGFFPLEGAILATVTAGALLISEAGIKNAVLLAVCGFLIQLILFERKSERGQKIWKRFFAKKSNI